MRDFYEQELKEVIEELNFSYKSWSSSMVTSWRLRDERDKYHSDAKYYFQKAKRSEELKSRFKHEVDVAARAVDPPKGELE